MQEATYRLLKIRKQLQTGVTDASSCSLNAILKFDSPESPHCVFNELVAVRIAQTLHVPIADGVLTSSGDGQLFASMEVASPGIQLPDILKSQVKDVASHYPNEVASLAAFDILIGNGDRSRNIKASLVSPHMPVFRAFDHSHALLTIEGDPDESIKRLKSNDVIVKFHPFFGLISKSQFISWLDRISSVGDIYFAECCRFGRVFRAVTMPIQEELAAALVWRKTNLKAIVSSSLAEIAPLP
jgi:hypothetical protein